MGRSSIAFSARGDSSSEIHVIGADGAGDRRVARVSDSIGPLAWAPDGKRLAFGKRGRSSLQQDGLCILNVEGPEDLDPKLVAKTALRRSSGAPAWIAWSPDGRRIAYDVEFHGQRKEPDGFGDWGHVDVSWFELHLMNADGSARQTLGAGRQPGWSADSHRLAFVEPEKEKSRLWSSDVLGSGGRSCVDVDAEIFGAAWSPGASMLAFTTGDGRLFAIQMDGTGRRELCSGQGSNHNLAWAPDGRRIAFDSFKDGHLNLFVVNEDGTGLRRLTSDIRTYRPAWSADGKHLAFESGDEIAVIDSDGTNLRRIARGASPSWSPTRSE